MHLDTSEKRQYKQCYHSISYLEYSKISTQKTSKDTCRNLRCRAWQKMKFSIKDFFSKSDEIREQTVNLVTFTEEILNGKLHFIMLVRCFINTLHFQDLGESWLHVCYRCHLHCTI